MRGEFHLGGSVWLVIKDLAMGSNGEGSRFGFEFFDAGDLVFSDACFETHESFVTCRDAAIHLVDFLTGDVLKAFHEDPEESCKYPPGAFVWLTKNLETLDYSFVLDTE